MESKYIFSTQKGKAYYWNTIPNFIKDDSDNIIGQLVKHSFEVNKDETDAWSNQIAELQNRLENAQTDGDIIFEYDIVRLSKRIDVVLLIKHMVFSIEFKNGKKMFTAQDARQAEDYAIDIKNFHKESENLYVCPILVATNAPTYGKEQPLDYYADKQIKLQRENIETLVPKVNKLTSLYGTDEKINFEKWFNSPYYPTPTIISAAIEAYSTHDISEIARSEAGQDIINSCEKKLNEIICYAKTNKKKCICFVTGVPGAGKTLVGLDVVSKNLKEGKDNLSVYISGNGPLVEVLREALKKSTKEKKQSSRETEAAINTLIQSSYAFKNDAVLHPEPIESKILIFDEAQRGWNKKQMIKKHGNNSQMTVSEPHLFYSVMNRHQDWAVMICLVGLGQDIYDGEVGINEWFECGINEFKNWELYYSPKIFDQTEDKNINRKLIEGCERCHAMNELHLSKSIRTFKAEGLCKFVDYLLDNNPQMAKEEYSNLFNKYPIFITRNVERAKKWAKNQVRGSQRCGLLASSGAQRLKPEGIFVPKDIDVKDWFLAPNEDLRSSNMMEVVASEFKVQGLEIDWSVVCWDADLRRLNDCWDFYSFVCPKWKHRNLDDKKRYLLNSYRVLLTRARQGMIIFVPIGVNKEEDETRDHEFYDGIYTYLKKCGIKEL